MKNLLLCLFVVMSGAMTATTIKNSVAGPTSMSLIISDSYCSAANGSIQITGVTGGVAPYTYSFNGSAYTATTNYTGLAAGSYTITVQDSNAATYTTSAIIMDYPGPTSLATTITNSSCGAADGSITLGTVTGGTAPYIYDFNGSGFTSTTSFTGLVAGSYTIIVKDANGCIFNTAVSITDSPGPTAVATTVTNSSCGAADGSVTINNVTGGTAPYTYNFNGSSFTATTVYSALPAGTYPINVKDANGCIFSTTVTITNQSGPTSLATTITNSSCGAADGSITITGVTGGTGPFIYSFNAASGAGPYTSTTSYTGLVAGTYTLEVKDVNGCIYSTSVTINNTGGPTSLATTITNSSCGVADGSVTLGTVTGGVAPYIYSFNGSGFTSTTSYTGLIAGSYPVVVKDANGCLFNTSATVIDNPGPTGVVITTVNSSCGAADGSITLGTVTGGTAPYTYSFNGSVYTSVTSYTGLVAGSYTIIVKDANGCLYTTTTNIIDNPGPTALATTIVDAVCSGANGSVTLGTVTGGTAPYIYDFNGSGFTSTTSYTGLVAGSYTIIVKDANGCTFTTSTTVTITNQSGPTAVATSVVNASCGVADGSVTLGAVTGGASSYTYNFNSVGFSTTTSYSGLLAGSYSLDVKDANGCIFSTFISINNTGGPTAIATTIVDASCGAADGSVTLGGAVTGGVAPYTYSFNGNAYTSTTNYPNLVAGSYTLDVKDANGCIFSTVVSISNIGGPTAIANTVVNESCTSSANGSVTLGTVTGGTAPYTYSFSGSAYTSTTNYPNLVAGTYFIDVKDTNGCIYSTSVTITTTGARSANISYPGSPFSNNLTSQQYVTLTGTGTYTGGIFSSTAGLAINPNTGAIIPNSSTSGTYTVTYTLPASGGCPAITATATVTISGSSYTDLGVYIYPGGNGGPRPGFTYMNVVCIRNYGNQTTSAGMLTFTKDSRVTITNVSPSATMTGTGFTYNYPSLAPNQSQYVYVTMQVPTIPTVNIEDLLTNSVSVDIPAGDINTASNSSSSTQDVRGAYDPNDKSEAHGPQIVHSTFTSADYLSYTIQFENTGNADALNIRVNDMLESQLDETTIKTIDASHSYVLDQTGSDLNWNFNNINLPPAGKGFINFQIKPKAGYAVGDIINNFASIYFDFNPAIVTNTFATEFVTTLGIAGFVNNQFSAYPNPTTGIITIALKNSANVINTIIVTDVLGKTVQTNNVNNANTTVDLSNLSKGLYFVKIQAEGQVNTLKVIKE